jgi:hypothetical protein
MALYEIDIGGPDWEQRYQEERSRREIVDNLALLLEERLDRIKWQIWCCIWGQIGYAYLADYNESAAFWSNPEAQEELLKTFNEIDSHSNSMTVKEFEYWLHSLTEDVFNEKLN